MKKDKYMGENIHADPITHDLDRRDFLMKGSASIPGKSKWDRARSHHSDRCLPMSWM